ncbi:hypothetical protein ID866_12514 [Astraeus odoratus]|nr:hypothetical protein ID866_12514 [Astraeus odoratus]
MTPSERLLLRAAEQTTREICRVVTRMWASGVLLGLDGFLNSKATLDTSAVAALLCKWKTEISSLIHWLDWSIWVKCQPDCSPEVCSTISSYADCYEHFALIGNVLLDYLARWFSEERATNPASRG